MLALINGIIITPKELIRDSAVIIKDTTITDIIPNKQLSHDVVKYDCKNRFIMPDLIDTHCDCIETQIVPRKGIIFDFESALMQFDKQLLGNGITTMYHSISIANSTIVNKRRTLSVELQLKIGEMIHSIKDFLIIAHKFHARLEMNTVEAVDTIMRLINDKCIDELSFMDHTPGQGQYRNLSMFKVEIEKQYGLLNETKKQQIISQCSSKNKISKKQKMSLIEQCHSNHIPLAYHDVNSIELTNWMGEHGFKICEFPITQEAAIQSNKLNIFNIVGAPNILHGQSHNGFIAYFAHKDYADDEEKNEFFNSFISRVILFDDKIIIIYNTGSEEKVKIDHSEIIQRTTDKSAVITLENTKSKSPEREFKRLALGGEVVT